MLCLTRPCGSIVTGGIAERIRRYVRKTTYTEAQDPVTSIANDLLDRGYGVRVRAGSSDRSEGYKMKIFTNVVKSLVAEVAAEKKEHQRTIDLLNRNTILIIENGRNNLDETYLKARNLRYAIGEFLSPNRDKLGEIVAQNLINLRSQLSNVCRSIVKS